MNLFQGVPFIIPDPAAEQRENAKIGMQFAQMFGDSFKAAQGNKTQNRQIDVQKAQWESQSAMRDAQLSIAKSNAQKAGIDAQNEAIIAENNKKMSEKQSEFAALNEQVEQTGWTNPYSKDMYYNFLTRNPEFVSTQYSKAMEEKFAKAEAIERQQEYWREKNDTRIATEQIKQQGKIDPMEKSHFEDTIKSIRENYRLTPDKQAAAIDEAYRSFRENGNRVVRQKPVAPADQGDNRGTGWLKFSDSFDFQRVN